MPSLYLYCMSFNLVGRSARYIIYQITCKKAGVFLIGPDIVTDTILFLGGVYMRKLAPARVSYWDDFLISYQVYTMTGSFRISLFIGTYHVD